MSSLASLQAALIGQRAAAASNSGQQANDLIAQAIARASAQRVQAAQYAAQLREQQRQRQMEAQLQAQQSLANMAIQQQSLSAADRRQQSEQQFQAGESELERAQRKELGFAELGSRERQAQIEADARRPVLTAEDRFKESLYGSLVPGTPEYQRATDAYLYGKGDVEPGATGSEPYRAAVDALAGIPVGNVTPQSRDVARENVKKQLLTIINDQRLSPQEREQIMSAWRMSGGSDSDIVPQVAAHAAPQAAPSGPRSLRSDVSATARLAAGTLFPAAHSIVEYITGPASFPTSQPYRSEPPVRRSLIQPPTSQPETDPMQILGQGVTPMPGPIPPAELLTPLERAALERQILMRMRASRIR